MRLLAAAATSALLASCARAAVLTPPPGAGTLAAAFATAAAGDTIELAAGEYTVSNTLAWPGDDVTVRGAGDDLSYVVADAAWTGGPNSWFFNMQGSVSGPQLLNAAAEGFTLRGRGTSSDGPARGFKAYQVTGLTLSGVSTEGFRRSGVDVNGCENVVIDGGTHTGHFGHGASIKDNTNLVLRNAEFAGNAWSGVSVSNDGRDDDDATQLNVIEPSVRLCGNALPLQLELNDGARNGRVTTHNGAAVALGDQIPMTYAHPRTAAGAQDVLRAATDPATQDFNQPLPAGAAPNVDIRVADLAWQAFAEQGSSNLKLALFFCCDAYPDTFSAFADGSLSGTHMDPTMRAWRDIRPQGVGGLVLGGTMDAAYAAAKVPVGEQVHDEPQPLVGGGAELVETGLFKCGCHESASVATGGTSAVLSFFGVDDGNCDEEPPVVPPTAVPCVV